MLITRVWSLPILSLITEVLLSLFDSLSHSL